MDIQKWAKGEQRIELHGDGSTARITTEFLVDLLRSAGWEEHSRIRTFR